MPATDIGDDDFAEAIAIANIPTLLMTLVQLSGETKWLHEPYRPSRARGMSDNDTGGLPDAVQQEIRDAALDAVLAWRDGRPVAIPTPPPAMLVEMLSVAMGEAIPDEYGEMIGAQVGLQDEPEVEPLDVPDGFEVLVVGAGVAGICAAISLQRAGIPFTVIEKNSTVGGTWWENRYPGAGVDTPNHLYSFSFAPYDWSMYFALRDELHEYLEHVADRFGLRRRICFGTQVEQLAYDADSQSWDVTVTGPGGTLEHRRPNVVISATGIFNPLKYPDIPGLDRFTGPRPHTAAWPADLDLTGKRVAVIGNGASAMQLGPEVQDRVASLTIFQRSAHWAAPFEHFRTSVPEPIRMLLREVPLYRTWYRARLGWTFNDRLHRSLQKDPQWEHPDRSLNVINDAHREYFTQYVVSELGERVDLLDKVLPRYPPFGKRMLMDNGWYRMLRNPKVELVDEPVIEITEHAVVTASSTHEADVLVIATGFDVLRFLTTFDTVGRDGRTLREVWDDTDARAYLGGLTVPGFPNLFVLYGPNTQPGHGGSIMFVMEMLMHYVTAALRTMIRDDIGALEVRQDVHDEYNARIDAAHERMVWTHPGMSTYYRNDKGRVVVNYPFRNVDLFTATSDIDLADYHVEPRRQTAAVPT
jgi:4-hydroxyacetophenone monooxygenase